MAQFLLDEFVGSAGTTLGSHTGETGATWTLNLATSGSGVLSDGGRLRATSATVAVYLASGAPTTADYQVRGRIKCLTKNGEFNGIGARWSSAANTGYVVAWNNSANRFEMYKLTAGVAASLGQTTALAAAMTVGESYDLFLTVNGATQAVEVRRVSDGLWCSTAGTYSSTRSYCITASDATITAAGKPAVYLSGIAASGNSVGFHIGAVAAGDGFAVPFDTATLNAAGTAISVYLDSVLWSSILPATGATGFAVSTGGEAVLVSSATISGSVATLNLSRTIFQHETLTVSYAPGNLTDEEGAALLAFSGLYVTNGSTQSPTAGASEVVLLGTQFGDAGTAGHELAKAFDEDRTNYFEAAGSEPHYVGLDAGAAVVLRRVQITPRSGAASVDYEERLKGAKIQGSNTSSSAGFVDLYTVPIVEPEYLPRYDRNEIAISTGGTAYRYYRLLEATGQQQFLAELKFITDSGPSLSKPVAPAISPWGGRYPSGSATVTITSRTASAAIYYTTDGSTPTNASTLYSGAFTLTIGASAKTVKAIAYDATLSMATSEVSSAIFNPWGFKPNEDWYDDRGVLIEAHGGDVIYVASAARYYWYGFSANKANDPASNGSAGTDILSYKGVFCYSSSDLLNWRFEGHLLAPPTGFAGLYRAHVRYNAATSKYVLWANVVVAISTTDAAQNGQAIVAVADSPTGPFRYVSRGQKDNGYYFKDNGFFVDDDGVSAYVVYNRTGEMIISKLNAAWTATTGISSDRKALYTGASPEREAPTPFRRGSTYFLITSRSNYYDGTATFDQQYSTCTAATPLGTWSAPTALFSTDPVGSAYNGQSSCVVKLPGKVDGYVYVSDRWSKTTLYDSRQVWLPLTFPGSTSLAITTPTSWDLSTFANTLTNRRRFLAGGGMF